MLREWRTQTWLRLKALANRKRLERDLREELQFHLAAREEKLAADGADASDARFAARRRLGNTASLKETTRELWTFASLENLWRDIRFGLRILRKTSGFTSIAILTLALGIGANAAIFSIMESQLWRALPFPDSERLVDAHAVLRDNARQWDVLSNRGFHAWRDQSRSFTNIAAYVYPAARNLSANGTSQQVTVMPVTSNLFDTLEVEPLRGRAFLSEEETPGRNHVAIVSYSLWTNQFASDPSLLGKSITLDSEIFTVVGIASPSLQFEYLEEPAIFVPITLDPTARSLRNLYVIGRLAPGVSGERSAVELTAILDREMKSEGVPADDVAQVAGLRETWTSFAARPLYFFVGAVALVLFIACVNTAGLLLARGLTRQREFAVRAALGAGRGTLMRQLLVESLLLAIAGGGAGAILGLWLAPSLGALLPGDAIPRHTPVTLDSRVLLFTIVVSVLSALIVGLAPAVFASRADLNVALRQESRGRSASRGQRNARSSLMAIEVALGLVLLFGTGLFLATFVRLQEAPRGFDAPGALTFRVSLRGSSYAKPDQMRRYFDRLTEKLAAIPGVRAVTLGNGLPLTGTTSEYAAVKVADRPPVHPHGLGAVVHPVFPNYFQVLGMHLLAGRGFNPHDGETSARVAIINQNAARDLFGSEEPLGKVLEFVPDTRREVPAQAPVRIIGVAENAQEFGADEVPVDDLYVPFPQHPVTSAYFVLASDVPRGSLSGLIRQAAYAMDKDQPVFDMSTMDDRVAGSLKGARLNLFLVGALGAVAILLVSVGIFGTVAYFVQQRTQEFGIRLALGASPIRILRHAISQSLSIGVSGIVIGVAASLILGRLLRHALYLAPHEHTGMLYGVSIFDPLTLSTACVFVVGVLLLASYVPARRAMRVDPMVALRHD